MNSCAINKHCALRQFSASNPPLLLAAKRYFKSKVKGQKNPIIK
jgi:hypothetical protein